jgi:hypothetical protein
MRVIIFICCLLTAAISSAVAQTQALPQRPCSSIPEYRQFDFWIGDWEVYAPNGNVAGQSRISMILDSCIILEEWTGGKGYAGKSFNSWNAVKHEWQQTWVDNAGGSTQYLRGTGEAGKITYFADNEMGANGKTFLRKLTFNKLSDEKVRQHGERSDDGGKTWTTEYDLEYRKKK